MLFLAVCEEQSRCRERLGFGADGHPNPGAVCAANMLKKSSCKALKEEFAG